MEDIRVIETPNYISVLKNISNIQMASAEISILNNEVWYFNRIIVPIQFRGKGIASLLMKELIKVIDKRNITLACDINPYGDLDFNQLDTFYRKYGFVSDKIFYLIRYPNNRKG